MSSLPSLGPRGEGWVVIQFVLIGIVLAAAWMEPASAGAIWPLLSTAGLALLIGGGFLASRGLSDLRTNLTPLPHPKDDAELVDTGSYALVRHPIYGGIVIGMLGLALSLQAVVTAVVGTVVLLVFFRLKSGREEAWLVQRFPKYEAYRAHTKRMIPFLY